MFHIELPRDNCQLNRQPVEEIIKNPILAPTKII